MSNDMKGTEDDDHDEVSSSRDESDSSDWLTQRHACKVLLQ
jgi:hypothetical protein